LRAKFEDKLLVGQFNNNNNKKKLKQTQHHHHHHSSSKDIKQWKEQTENKNINHNKTQQ